MKYYVVLDTNVIVSATIKIDSNPGLILRLVDDGIIIPLINEEIIAEYIIKTLAIYQVIDNSFKNKS